MRRSPQLNVSTVIHSFVPLQARCQRAPLRSPSSLTRAWWVSCWCPLSSSSTSSCCFAVRPRGSGTPPAAPTVWECSVTCVTCWASAGTSAGSPRSSHPRCPETAWTFRSPDRWSPPSNSWRSEQAACPYFGGREELQRGGWPPFICQWSSVSREKSYLKIIWALNEAGLWMFLKH